MKKKLIFVIILIVIALAVTLYFILSSKNQRDIQEDQEAPLYNNHNENNELRKNTPLQENTFNITESDNPKNNLYIDSQYGFLFQYPKGFTVTKFSETEDSNTILIQKKETNQGFQIFISSFDEPGPLTKERILKDLPDLVIKNPEQRVLKNGAVALIFFSEESSIGETREIWFINNGFLYQVSTRKELDNLTAQMFKTWEF